MSAPKLSFEETLLEKVVLKEICSGCAACVLVCPFGCLEYFEERPNLVKKCEICGICPRVCPRYDFSQAALEKLVFEREHKPDEEFGIYRRLVIAQAIDKNILRVCQDGGVVTALLTFALENHIIDGAAVSGLSPEKPLYPIPKLATSRQEVLECAGTRYTYSPNLLAFREGIKQKKKNLVYVGTPCQIQAIRRIQMASLKKYADPLNLTIGLMCTESFDYEGLMKKHIEKEMGISLSDIKKINIKAKLLVTPKSGEEKIIPLKEAKQYTRKSCTLCTDFSAELADISAGGLGMSDWTFTILRTKRGEELFKNAEKKGVLRTKPVEDEEGKRALDLLVKLSKRKRETK